MDNRISLKSMSKKQLANAYGVSIKTLNSWLKPFDVEIGIYRGRSYTPKQVTTIVEHLGLTDSIAKYNNFVFE